MDGKWVDVKPKLDILTIIGTETKSPVASALGKDDKADHFAPETKVDGDENKDADLRTPATYDGHVGQVCSPDKKDQDSDDQVNDKSEEESDNINRQVGDQNMGDDDEDDGSQREGKSGAEDPLSTETTAQNDVAVELNEVAA